MDYLKGTEFASDMDGISFAPAYRWCVFLVPLTLLVFGSRFMIGLMIFFELLILALYFVGYLIYRK